MRAVATMVPVRSLMMMRAGGVNASALAQLMSERIAGGWTPEGELPRWDGVRGAAQAIAGHVKRIAASSAAK